MGKVLSGTRMRPFLAVLAALGLILALGACDPPKPNIVYYGDSLTNEAGGAFTLAVTGNKRATVSDDAVGGTAPCDYFASAKRDAATAPAAVVMAWSGNT